MEVGDTLQFCNDAFFSDEDLHLNGKAFTVTRLWRQGRDKMVDIEVEGVAYDGWTIEVLETLVN